MLLFWFRNILLAFIILLAVSPFVLQPGINVSLPESPFAGGARFGSMVLSITRGGWFYFNNERLDEAGLLEALETATLIHPDAMLIIEADERVEHGTVIKAWNVALEAGILEVSMATKISAAEEPIL